MNSRKINIMFFQSFGTVLGRISFCLNFQLIRSIKLNNMFCSNRESVDGESWYYSTPAQLDELLETLDPLEYEAPLCREINEFKEEIIRQMELTEKITNQHKGNKKSYLETENSKCILAQVVLSFNFDL